MENRGSQPQAVVVQRAEYRNIWTQNWLLGHTPSFAVYVGYCSWHSAYLSLVSA